MVSATQITFTAPALATGSYVLYVVNTDGGTAVVVPGIQYSGVPSWTTAAGTLGTVYETAAISSTVAATSDSAVSYSVISGALPTGATLASNGTISGTSPVTASSTTYTFTVRANDAENQETDRTFNLTISPDVVTWSSPANAATLTGSPGVAYSSALTAASAAGQTVSYSASALPAGLAISGATITGTPTTAGTSSTTLTATSAVTNRSAQVTISWTITVAADTYFPLTTLLLNSETTALPFTTDASANNFALTVNGDTKPSNFNPYTPGYYSNYFDGSGDWLNTATNAALALGAGDFTTEFWIYPTTTASNQVVFDCRPDGSHGAYAAMLFESGYIRWYVSSATQIQSTSTLTLNSWTHVAVTRSSGTTKMYINGVVSGSAWTDSTTYLVGAAGLNVGASTWSSGRGAFTGNISNLRVVKGTAVYTTNFTPATTPLTAIANTQLLTCQSNRFIDNSANAFAVTKAGDVAVSPFDPFAPNSSYATYGSTYFDGTGDYLSTTGAGLTASGNFTVEAWIYITAGGTACGFVNTQGVSTSGIFLGMSSVNVLMFKLGSDSGGFEIADTVASPINTWIHVAGVRSGNTLTLYKNGVSVASVGSVTNTAVSTTAVVGRYYSDFNGFYFNGYISDARIVTGTAVYTGNFTPPTTPLTAVANTALLTCQTNQPVNNQTFLDNSSNAFPVTRTGNATQGSFSPYGANWSTYFDGSGQALFNSSFGGANFGTSNNFTIEMWVNWTSAAAGNNTVFELTGTTRMIFGRSTTGIRLFNNGTERGYATTIPLNTWNHLAIVRNSGTISVYVNGVLGTSFADTTNWAETTFYTSKNSDGVEVSSAHYISNLRVVNGTAVYTAAFTPPTQPLTAIAGTTLLICQSSGFVDNSFNQYPLSLAGTPSTQKFNPFATVTQTPNTYSTYFGTKTDYVSIPATTALTTYTGDFTFECWVNPTDTSLTSSWSIWDSRQSGGTPNAMCFSLVALASPVTGQWRISYYNGTSYYGTGIVNVNQWSHIAFVRSGSTMTFYVNGVAGGTATISGTQAGTATTNPVWIGTKDNGIGTFGTVGYISNFRIVNGTAVYTTNFTPATTPLTTVANTVLLTCQDARFVDNSTNAYTLTAGSATTTPRRQNPFGFTTSSTQDYSTTTFGGSVYLDGSDYLTVPNTTVTAFGTGDFTIEFWTYLDKFGDNRFIDFASSSIMYMGSDTMVYYINGAKITSSAMVLNNWYHVALVRSSGTSKMYLNGTQTGVNYTDATDYGSSGTSIIVGTDRGSFGQFLKGYMSDLRITKGTAVYKANFVPPVAPLTAIQNTTLLLSGDKAAVQDKSGKVVLETVGDAKISTAVKKYGSSSMYFDGTGDNLTLSSVVRPSIGTGDFTVELWAYHLNTSAYSGYYWGGSSGLVLRRTDGNKLELSHDGVASIVVSTANIPANQWTHIAATRSGGAVKIFIDGVVAGTVTYATSIVGTTAPTVGSISAVAGYYMNGYIDDLRVTNGYARYTANFTPPSSALLTK